MSRQTISHGMRLAMVALAVRNLIKKEIAVTYISRQSNATLISKLASLLLVLPFMLVVGCSSPEKQANAYYEKGMALLKEGKPDKAQIEFKNALQIKKNMGKAMYGMSLVAEQKGDWQQLFNLLTGVLEQDPKNLEAQVKLGRLLLAAGKLDKALDASNKAMALNKGDVSVLALRAATLLKLNDPKGAIENANLALSKDPNNIDSLVVLASERMLAGDSTKAIEYLDRGLKQNDKNVALQLIKIEALNNLSQMENVEQVFRKLIAFYPDAKLFRQALARFYLKHERKDEAEAEYRSIVTSLPGDMQAKLELVGFLRAVKGVAAARQQFETFASKEPGNFPLNIALVQFYMGILDSKAAEAKLNELITKAGNSTNGLEAKGILAASIISRGDKKTGEKMIAEILAKDSRNEQALIMKASLAIERGKTDEAISDLRTILRDVPNSSQALLLLAQAHDKAGAPELADEHYMRAFQSSKMAAPYGLTYAQYLLKRNQAARAEKILEQVLAATPGNDRAMKMLAQTRIAQGNWTGAQEVADEIKKRDDKGIVPDQIAGAIFAGKHNYAESISAFKRAYEAAPNQPQPMLALVRTYLLAGKPKEAQGFLESVVQANPENLDARVMQGQLYAMNGEKDKAIEAFSSVISRAPKSSVGYQQLATMHLRANQASEAEKVVDKGLAAVPGDLNLRLTQAGILELSKRNDEAIQAYEALLKERPDSEVLANNLASLLADNRTDKASLNRAYELVQRFRKSEVPQFKDTLGWISYRVGKTNEAIPLLEDAVKQLPEVPVLRYHLGMSYLAKGDKSKAREELEKALQLAGTQSFDQAEEIRKTLKGL